MSAFDDDTSALEASFGDAVAGDGPLGWRAAMARDEAERFPDDALTALRDLGLRRLHVPASLGGSQASFEAALGTARCLARRDPSVALAEGLSVWSHLAWSAGTEAQTATVRDHVLSGATISLAASEGAHGADLLAGEVTARRDREGFTLDGKKWPIGGASRAALAFVLARTGDSPGPRSLSWLLVDEAALAHASRLPPVRTLGLRAADLSGLDLRGVRVPEGALVGPEGAGLELVLRLFQISRSLVTALALGAADSALRIAASFAAGRQLYRTTAAATPAVAERLAGAYVDLLAAEVLARVTARGLHVAPAEASVASAIAKVLVPALTGRSVQAAAEVLGARFYLREGIAGGVFQKLLRDHMAIGLFDGSTLVCLQSLVVQLPLLLEPRARAVVASPTQFALGAGLPAFDSARLDLTTRGEDGVARGLEVASLDASLGPAHDDVRTELRALERDFAAFRAAGSPDGARAPRLFHLAERYAAAHAAAACLQVATHAALPPDLPHIWAAAAVRRLLHPHVPLGEHLPRAEVAALAAAALRDVAAPRSLSLTPIALPDTPISDNLP